MDSTIVVNAIRFNRFPIREYGTYKPVAFVSQPTEVDYTLYLGDGISALSGTYILSKENDLQLEGIQQLIKDEILKTLDKNKEAWYNISNDKQ